MKVHLWATGSAELDGAIEGFTELAQHSRHGHTLVADPSDADLILLTQAHLCPDPLAMRALRAGSAWRQHRDVTCVVDFRDRPWCAFPGLYTSMPRPDLQARWQRPWLYPWIDEAAFRSLRSETPDLLFSFIGGRSHPCRAPILELDSPVGLVEDSTGFDYLDRSHASVEPREHFRSVVARSKFVLCPRGHATSSFRLQEVLAAGRVPVIVSDDWVEPIGPDWSSATVRWPEDRIDELPDHLLEIEPRVPDMSRAAAALYDEWFASEVMFDRMCEQLAAISPSQGFPRHGIRGRWYLRLLLARTKARILARRSAPGRT